VPGELRRYAAPAGFLLAVTIAVVLIHSALQGSGAPHTSVPVTHPAKQVETTPGTTTKSRKTKPAQRFWTVQAGDTFAVISSKSGVPVTTIERLNPNVKSTSLFIGQKLRIK
jgi:LysM repeat protein